VHIHRARQKMQAEQVPAFWIVVSQIAPMTISLTVLD